MVSCSSTDRENQSMLITWVTAAFIWWDITNKIKLIQQKHSTEFSYLEMSILKLYDTEYTSSTGGMYLSTLTFVFYCYWTLYFSSATSQRHILYLYFCTIQRWCSLKVVVLFVQSCFLTVPFVLSSRQRRIRRRENSQHQEGDPVLRHRRCSGRKREERSESTFLSVFLWFCVSVFVCVDQSSVTSVCLWIFRAT